MEEVAEVATHEVVPAVAAVGVAFGGMVTIARTSTEVIAGEFTEMAIEMSDTVERLGVKLTEDTYTMMAIDMSASITRAAPKLIGRHVHDDVRRWPVGRRWVLRRRFQLGALSLGHHRDIQGGVHGRRGCHWGAQGHRLAARGRGSRSTS